MSMTELERRCAFVLQNLDETWDNPSCGRSYEEIARAVLAEAGVAELVEALCDVRQWIDGWTPDFVQDDEWPDTAARIDAAIAKGSQWPV